MKTDVGSAIAEFIETARYDDMPAKAVSTAKTAILDCLGVALAGSRSKEGLICAQMACEEKAKGEASAFGQGFRTSALEAAFVNGVAAHAEDYDHTFIVMAQPTAPVIPAVFALGEAQGCSGRQILEAYIAGFEVTASLAFSLRDAAPSRGWHTNGTVGVFGSTTACSKLLGLGTARIKMAIGITASLASGLGANFGTMTKPLHVGHASRNGVLAAKLAAGGYTARETALDARGGYFPTYYRGFAPDLNPFDGLGQTYALAAHGVRIKPYPCGGLTHSAIDAALNLRRQYSIESEMVESVEVDVMETTFNAIVFKVPKTAIEAKFCMPYLIARALTDGNVTLGAFTKEAVANEAVLKLAERVDMQFDPALQADKPGDVARVKIRLRSGETYTEVCNSPKGSPGAPMGPTEMEAKFRECAAFAISKDATDEALELIESLEKLNEVGRLCELLRGR